MGMIKTALEIALEKTETVKSERSSINQFEAKQRGKKLANAFLSGEIDLTAEIKKTAADQQESLKQGIFDVLITKIALPMDKNDEKRIEAAGKGFQTIINNNQFTALYKQLSQLFSQFLQEAASYQQAILKEYAPQLRQKEEEISRRIGREVRIDPMQDPEFVAFYNQHMNALKNNYQGIVEQAKEQIRNMFEK